MIVIIIILSLSLAMILLSEQNMKAQITIKHVTPINKDPKSSYLYISEVPSNKNSVGTFSANGLIASSLFQSLPSSDSNATILYILGGYWNLDIIGGLVDNFEINFTKVRPDGTEMRKLELTNFKQNRLVPIMLDLNKGTSFAGMVDIKVGDDIRWIGSPVRITIHNLNTISITPNNEYTDNFFRGLPIYGVVSSLITGKNNTSIVQPIL